MRIATLTLLTMLFAASVNADTLEQRRAELAAAPGVLVAVIQIDGDGQPIIQPIAALRTPQGTVDLFPGYGVARISYLYQSGDTIADDTVSLIVNTETGDAHWQTRRPHVLDIPPPVEPVDEAAAIIAAIETSQSVKVIKWSITYYDGYADVEAAIDSAGKLRDAKYYVAADDKGALVVKPYDDGTVTAIEAPK